ncbi:MAG: hypothetical protein WD749_14800 [Phycisphaerales bacterium]
MTGELKAFPSILPEFSTAPLPRIEPRMSDGIVTYTVAGEDVGLRSAVDLVVADQRCAALRRYAGQDGRRRIAIFRVIDTPTKRMTVDVFLHPEVYPGSSPELAIYNTVERGIVRIDTTPSRENDRFHQHDVIRPIAGGLANARLAHVPRYPEMLRHVCGKLGLAPAEFRGFRLDVHYPIYGAQYQFGFTLPHSPTSVHR